MRVLLVCCAVLAGCARASDQPSADTSAMAPPPSSTIALADVAGTWELRSVSETGDSTITTYRLRATADANGWQFHIADRDPIPVRVVTSGDSIMTAAGPFESALRRGIPVTLQGVLRHVGGRLVGTTVAHFASGGPDSTLRVRTEGTRVP